MQIQIQFISANVEDKGRYKQAEIAYKDVAKGQVTSKKIMSFNNPAVYKTLVDAKNGELYTVEMQKNDKGYWDWTAVSLGGGSTGDAAPTTTAKTFTAPKSTYETPEERAQRQVYIIRQSSAATAVAALKTDKKAPTAAEVIAFAQELEGYVFGNPTKIVSLADLPPIDTDEDIPV